MISDGNLKFESWNGSTWYNVDNLGIDCDLNQWQYIALTYDGSQMIVYKNADSRSNAYSHILTTDDYNFLVGRRECTSPTCEDMFAGTIDDVQIYDRALSAEEVWQLYQKGND